MKKVEIIQDAFHDTRDIIRAYDIKASFVLAATALLLTKAIDIYFSQVQQFSSLEIIVVIFASGSLFASMIYSLMVIYPRSSLAVPKEDKDLNNIYYPIGIDLEEYSTKLRAFSEDADEKLYSQQLFKLKAIREYKHEHFKKSIKILIFGVITFLILIIIIAIKNDSKKDLPKSPCSQITNHNIES